MNEVDADKSLKYFAQNLFGMYYIQAEGTIFRIRRGEVFDRSLRDSLESYEFDKYRVPEIDFIEDDGAIRCLQSGDIWDHVIREAMVIQENFSDVYRFMNGSPFYRTKIKLNIKNPQYVEFRDFVIGFRERMEKSYSSIGLTSP